MSEMIERVARALAKTDGDPAVLFDYYLEHARAAIEAMREPTKDMIDEGHRHDPLACDVGENQIAYVYGTMYRAMIDAALATEPAE